MQVDLVSFEGPNLPAHLLGNDPINSFLIVGIQRVAFRVRSLCGHTSENGLQQIECSQKSETLFKQDTWRQQALL